MTELISRELVNKFVYRALSVLRIRPKVGGLEVSDSVMRYVYYDGEKWQSVSSKLPPSLIQSGKVIDHNQFVVSLRELHAQIAGKKTSKKINVVVSLSSVNVYSQVFSLPVIEGENLEKAIQLNIQMVSPAESSQTYSGWQLLGEDQKSVRLEILSSFINKVVVDDVGKALSEAGFIVHSIESRALSLTRVVRELGAGFDMAKSYIVVSLDSSGLEFLVIRRGQLYFQYFNYWRDIYGEEKQITKEAFQGAIIRNLHQVLNFYNSHWADTLGGIFLSVSSMKDAVAAIIKENFSLDTLDLQLKTPTPLNPDWFVAMGSALRAHKPQREDLEISLLGISAQDEFLQNQSLSFLEMWRVIIPASLSILLIAFLGSNFFLGKIKDRLKSEVENQSPAEVAEVTALQKRVDEFNRTVNMVQGTGISKKNELLEDLRDIASENNVIISRIYAPRLDQVLLTGIAANEDKLKAFSEALKKSSRYSSTTLPLAEVKSGPEGVSFFVNINAASIAP